MIVPALVSLGKFLPGKEISQKQMLELCTYLNESTHLHKEYIDFIQNEGKYPGYVETNFAGWESKPWFDEWLSRLPIEKQKNPFQGTKERLRVPFDPKSLKTSIIPHPMLASDAEVIAGADAIIRSGLKKEDIDLIITHSQIQDRPLPSNASLVQHKLKLTNAGAYAIDTCCSSFLTMMEVAYALIKSGMKKNILIVSSVIDSFINDKSDYYSVNTGDAAVAGIISNIEADEDFFHSHSISKGENHDAIVFERREPHMLNKTDNIASYMQNFVTFFNMESCKLFAKNSPLNFSFVCNKTLEKCNLDVDEIDFLITHQPVYWAPEAWRKALNVPETKFYSTFEKYGNIATCSTGINLLESIEKGFIKSNSIVLAASSGAGENYIAILFKANKYLISNCSMYL